MSEQRSRSPRYPSMPLDEAIDLARKVYAGDGMHAVDREVAAGHLGYRGLSGASAQALASLAQYGLIESSGKGQVRLTSLALDIIEPQDDAEKERSLRAAAWTPRLFSELRDRFPATTPSEGNLRAYLIRQQFSASALKSVIPAYLKTCEYLAAEGASESHGQPSSMAENSPNNQTLKGASQMEAQVQSRPSVPIQIAGGETLPLGTRREVFALDEGEVVITLPNRLSADSIADIEDWLAIVGRKLRRMATPPKDAVLSQARAVALDKPSETEDDEL